MKGGKPLSATSPPGGRGDGRKIGGEPHTPPLRCENTARNTLQRPVNAERAMSDAWGRKHRAANAGRLREAPQGPNQARGLFGRDGGTALSIAIAKSFIKKSLGCSLRRAKFRCGEPHIARTYHVFTARCGHGNRRNPCPPKWRWIRTWVYYRIVLSLTLRPITKRAG